MENTKWKLKLTSGCRGALSGKYRAEALNPLLVNDAEHSRNTPPKSADGLQRFHDIIRVIRDIICS